MISAWHRFFHTPSDPRIPAMIRVGYAGLVIINLVAWYPYLEMWYGESGILPKELFERYPHFWTVLSWLPAGEPALQICFWTFAAQTLCLLLGIASRFSAISVFLWLASFQHRNPNILDAEDKVLRLIGFFLIFMPLAEAWSMDAWLFRRPGKSTGEQYQSASSPWALRVLQYVMVLIMFSTALCKLEGESWRDGTALYYVARVDDLFGRFPVPHYLFDTPWTVRAMSWLVLAAELLVPILIWFRDGRRFCLLVLLVFHLSNEYTMHLFLFHWIMLCGWMSFLKKEDLDAAARFWGRITGQSAAAAPRAAPAAK